MKVDYIIVGLGIAGICFSKQLLDHNKSFLVIADGFAGATQNSGGVFNPIVLRRFTAPDDTVERTEYAIKTYEEIQSYTPDNWLYRTHGVFRIFASVEEQNNWFAASDKAHLKPFISPKVQSNTNPYILAEYGLGEVTQSFKIDSLSFIHSFKEYLLANQKIRIENFNHKELHYTSKDHLWQYKDVEAKRIVFAEGAQVLNNPYLTTDVILPNKGEYLIVKAPKLKLDYMLKGGVYIIPLGKGLYKVGATYSREDATKHPTEIARKEIEAKLQKMITCDYQVVDQVTGIRPVTIDRHPILGEIKDGMYIFNGLGTRGFTRGPSYSKHLYDAIENNQPVPSVMDVKRFMS